MALLLIANSNNFNQDNCTVGQPTSECQEQILCADNTQELLELLTNSKDEIITLRSLSLKTSDQLIVLDTLMFNKALLTSLS